MNRKRAPGRLSRAIVTLAARTGNKLIGIGRNEATAGELHNKEVYRTAQDCQGCMRLSERTTITVETERLLVVRRELK